MDRFELYYNYASSQILEQNSRRQSTEGKARFLLTLSIALIGVAGLVTTNFGDGEVAWDSAAWIFAILAAIAFMCSLGLSLLVLHVREWHISPHPEELRNHVQNREYSDEELLEWTADGMTASYIFNDLILRDKASKLWMAMIAVVLEVVLLLGLIVSIIF